MATEAGAFDWSGADLVFLCSTCFDDALMQKLALAAARLRLGAVVVTLTKPLPLACFEVLHSGKCVMGWGGRTTFFIQRRIRAARVLFQNGRVIRTPAPRSACEAEAAPTRAADGGASGAGFVAGDPRHHQAVGWQFRGCDR